MQISRTSPVAAARGADPLTSLKGYVPGECSFNGQTSAFSLTDHPTPGTTRLIAFNPKDGKLSMSIEGPKGSIQKARPLSPQQAREMKSALTTHLEKGGIDPIQVYADALTVLMGISFDKFYPGKQSLKGAEFSVTDRERSYERTIRYDPKKSSFHIVVTKDGRAISDEKRISKPALQALKVAVERELAKSRKNGTALDGIGVLREDLLPAIARVLG
jgi:hypothetical protein